MNEEKNKPHGLGIGFQVEVFDNINGELIPVKKTEQEGSKLEAYINIKNEKTGKEVELPMRSFVQKFLSILYKYFTGTDTNASGITRISTASAGASNATYAAVKRKGLLAGTGITPVTLSDTDVETDASHASLAYGATTFLAPYVSDVTNKTMKFELRRMLISVKNTTSYISELAVKTQPVGATSTHAGIMLSRDILMGNPDEESGVDAGIPISFDEGIAFQFKFKISQIITGAYQGGAVLNFAKMIYNLMFKGSVNGSPLIGTTGANLTLSYGTASIATKASIANPFHVRDAAATTNYGILVGVYNSREYENPPIDTNDYNFVLVTSGLTIGATEVAAITNPSLANTAQFIVSRTFTNSGTTAIRLNRAGLKIKGAAFIAINTLAEPSDDIPGYLTLQPNQVLKVSYPFQIQA